MGNQAVALAKRVGYYSAGTCEFLVDENKRYYFLELNTRLQVEHPITESITGLDLVEHMIRIAGGQKLSLKQRDIAIKGHAIEARVYAEDAKTYLPSTGTLSHYIEPTGPLIRCDSGVTEGSEISVFYDPMICKICTHAPTRSEAITAMKSALDKFLIRGVKTNTSLLFDIMTNTKFIESKLSTSFLSREYADGFEPKFEVYIFELAVIASYIYARKEYHRSKWVGSLVEGLAPHVQNLFITTGKHTVNTKVYRIDECISVILNLW